MREPEEYVSDRVEAEMGMRTVQQSGYPSWPLSSHLPKHALVVTRAP